MNGRYLSRKRIFDFVLSFLALLFFSPLFFLIAFGIKISSKGPVFFKSKRIGRNGKKISCLKFRTMNLNAEQILDELLKKSACLRKEWDHFQKLKKDPRIFPFGAFLRKTSLDELPQFVNVLLGELSLVGPRPYLRDQVENKLGKESGLYLSIQPGITGLWQISGRNQLTFEQRLEIEKEYIKNRSFCLDLKIIFKTILVVIFRKGAY